MEQLTVDQAGKSHEGDGVIELPDPAGIAGYLNAHPEIMGSGWRDGSAVAEVAVVAQLTSTGSGRPVLTGLLLLGGVITSDKLRKIPVTALENSFELSSESAIDRVREETAGLAPLERTPDMAPEDFSALVAEHYKVWDRYVPNAAAALAAEWGIKPPTVHSWIREARLRGLLPPARRGKAKLFSEVTHG